jgi:hypothetical protein
MEEALSFRSQLAGREKVLGFYMTCFWQAIIEISLK